MKKNMSKADAIIRIIVATVILILWYSGAISGTILIVLAVVAAIFMITGFINFCPLYGVLGIRTRPKSVE
ncbi:MAG: DUF2892 domain-containing protein [Cyclobacteriaceae bacterium]